ncbi:tryptophan 7-halogenase [Paraglaciecola sp. L3A3]|uniref:tryptophan 7-halogenase n=1 Tax=Paraglaciecola sp. L3A3 TaxID=2686358 RepID=UPI00131E2C55|nr:tryptophan 7-halogenase [Paraglaciecola sp. L3A3]
MNESMSIKHIVLVGQHLPLMMSAVILSSQLADQPVRITAVEIKGGDTGQVESTGSEFMSLCNILKLPFKNIMQQCKGTFSLGQRYINQQRDWFVSYGHFGIQGEDNEFVQGLLRLKRSDPSIQLESASIAAHAAKQGKFAIPPASRPDLQQALDFAVNLEANNYEKQLKEFALARKVTFIKANSFSVNCGADFDIEAITLDGQHELTADFWIDCSGDLTRFMANHDEVTTQSNDSCWDKYAECLVDDKTCLDQPYNQLHVTHWGWLKILPLAEQACVQLEYNSQQVSEVEINQWLADYLSLSDSKVELIVHRKNKFKMNAKAWQGNCLSVGNSNVSMSKLFFSELYFVQAALVQFLGVYPSLGDNNVSKIWFNNQWLQFIAEANDYVQCHYAFLEQGSLVSASIRSKKLQQRLDLFQRLGRLTTSNTDAVSDVAWNGLLAGMGIIPQLSSLYLSNMSNEQLHDSLNKIKLSIDKLVAGMPHYRDFYHQFNRS